MNRIDAHRNVRRPASKPGPAPDPGRLNQPDIRRGRRTVAWAGLAYALVLAPAERSHGVATTAERACEPGADDRPGRSAQGGPGEVVL